MCGALAFVRNWIDIYLCDEALSFLIFVGVGTTEEFEIFLALLLPHWIFCRKLQPPKDLRRRIFLLLLASFNFNGA